MGVNHQGSIQVSLHVWTDVTRVVHLQEEVQWEKMNTVTMDCSYFWYYPVSTLNDDKLQTIIIIAITCVH